MSVHDYMASNCLLCLCLVVGVAVSQTIVQPNESPPTSDTLQGASQLQSDFGLPSPGSLGWRPRPGDGRPFRPPDVASELRNQTTMRFTREPQSQVVKNGASAELACAVNVDGVTIQWLYGGKPLEPNKRKWVRTDDGTLVISRVRRNKNDAGIYQCKVLSVDGAMLSRPAQLTIAELSREFAVSPANTSAPAGGTVLLQCSLDSVPPARISWLRDGQPLDVNGTERYSTDVPGQLIIRRLAGQDAGEYSCVGYNEVVGRQRGSGVGVLSVTAEEAAPRRPTLLNAAPAGPLRVAANSSLVVPCVADGRPPPDVRWTRVDGDAVPPSAVTAGGSLRLSAVRYQDAGVYVCTASNTAGQVSQETTVEVLVPPVLTSQPPPLMKLQTARLLRLVCKADGHPPPAITWLKDGHRITSEKGRIRAKQGELVIVNLQTADAGIYQCLAYNVADYAAAAVHLAKSRSAPLEPPSGLRTADITSRSARVSWNVTHPEKYLAYTVHCRKTADDLDADAKVSGPNVSSYTLQGLKPFTSYTVYVRAYSPKGASDPSEAITFTTAEDVPSQAPRVTLVAVSPTKLNVSWEALPPELSNGVITGYRILTQRHDDPATASSVELNADRRSYLITGLEPGKAYDVRVQAATRVGYPEVTADFTGDAGWLLQRMPHATSVSESPRPPTVHLAVSNHSTIQISWEMPSRGQAPPPVAFNVLYRKQEPTALLRGPIRLPGNASEYYLTGLTPNTWYEVHVQAVSADGQAAQSTKTISTLAAEPPDVVITSEVLEPPVKVQVEALNSSAVLVSWQEPPSARTIQSFTVKYRPLGREESQPTLLSSTSREVTVIGLKPFTYYEFAVRSNDAVGTDGPYSDSRKVRTLEGAPSSPENVTWSPLDASQILVRWRPPRRPHGRVSGYRVLYSSDRALPLARWQQLDIPASSGTQMQISQLVPNQKYWLRVRARTAVSFGELSDIVEFEIPAVLKTSGLPHSAPEIDASTYAILSVVALLLVVLLVVVAVLALRWRRRRQQPAAAARPPSSRPFLGNAAASGAAGSEQLEMEALTPMLNHVTPASDHQLDTKGGQAPTKPVNGRANGFVHPLYLSTDRLRHGSDEQNESRVSLINNNSSALNHSSDNHQPP